MTFGFFYMLPCRDTKELRRAKEFGSRRSARRRRLVCLVRLDVIYISSSRIYRHKQRGLRTIGRGFPGARSQQFSSVFISFNSFVLPGRPGRMSGTEQEIPSVRMDWSRRAPFLPLRSPRAFGKWDQKSAVCSASSFPFLRFLVCF